MATFTVGTSGRTYTTIQAAWNALPETLAEHYVLECYNDSEFTAGLDTAADTKDLGAYTVTIRPATGHGYRDHANKLTNALRYNSSNGVSFATTETSILFIAGYAGVILDGLAIKNTLAGGQGVQTWGHVKNCLIQASGSSAGTPALVMRAGTTAYNNIVIQTNNGASGLNDDGGSVLKGNTVVYIGTGSSSAYGIRADSGVAVVAQNNAVFGFASGFSTNGGSYHSSSDYNATNHASIGTGQGTNNVVSLTFASQFEAVGTLGSEDLRVKSGAGLIAEGLADAAITPDFLGQTRATPPSIGAVERIDSGPGTLSGSSSAGLQTTPGSNRFIGL